MYKYRWTIDSWANVHDNREQTANTIKIFHDGSEKWSGNMAQLWSTGGKISSEYFAKGRFSTFRIEAYGGADKKDLFLVDWFKLETLDHWGQTCHAQQTWGGDNSYGWCLTHSDPFADKDSYWRNRAYVDIPMKHCWTSKIYEGIQVYRDDDNVYQYRSTWEPGKHSQSLVSHFP